MSNRLLISLLKHHRKMLKLLITLNQSKLQDRRCQWMKLMVWCLNKHQVKMGANKIWCKIQTCKDKCLMVKWISNRCKKCKEILTWWVWIQIKCKNWHKNKLNNINNRFSNNKCNKCSKCLNSLILRLVNQLIFPRCLLSNSKLTSNSSTSNNNM